MKAKKAKKQQEIKALINRTFCLPENSEQLRVELEKPIMKRVSFCEQTRVYYPIMHGEVHWIQNEPLSSEEEVLKRRSRFQKLRREMYSTLRLSHALQKAAYSDMKKQQVKERLQGANAAWQDKDTETEFVVVQKVSSV